MEQSVTETALSLQEQLDKLRSVIENMMTSSSTLLSMSMPSVPEPEEAQAERTCPACSLDLSEKVSQLFKRYEQLQDLVNSFTARHTEGKPVKKAHQHGQEGIRTSVEMAKCVVIGNCQSCSNRSSPTTAHYRAVTVEDEATHRPLPRQTLSWLLPQQKADKAALASKVSFTQFDATTEQLNKLIQELLNKMSGQEQDWHKVLDKLLTEMDSKLDRLELDPFRQQLEDRWKSIRKQLKERSPHYQSDDAAGIRRRLLGHFHCISFDRPLEMVVPGPHIATVPTVPGLPTHRSIRPYTVYELEQIRQHSRNLKLGPSYYPRLEGLEKSTGIGKLRRIHSKMLLDIEKVQVHYGGSATVSSQTIRELLHAQCLGPGQYGKRGLPIEERQVP
uniref:DUF4795 domain-containing protein n=1 Tax=Sphenodon punctatus TaxID=8508 RepID=A0A8D0L620_SPHPU